MVVAGTVRASLEFSGPLIFFLQLSAPGMNSHAAINYTCPVIAASYVYCTVPVFDCCLVAVPSC